MKIFKLIGYDIKQGFRENTGKLAVLMGITLFCCIDFWVYRSNCYYGEIVPQGTYMDYLLYFLAGAKEYVPELDETFPFPARWFLLQSFLLYGGLSYSVRDMMGMGAVVLTKAETRWQWWLAKCAWNGLYIIGCYAIIYLVTWIWCVCVGEKLSFFVTASVMNEMLKISTLGDPCPVGLTVYILLIPLCTMVTLNILQLTLILFVPPVFGFASLEVLFVCSIYYCNGWFIGNYAMPLRSEYMKEQGFTMEQAMIVNVLLCCILVFVGGRRFQRYDILPKED